ncbi:hypothetical protein [Brevundimonas sp. FT23042]|uniref:hypothetical protein n=1 Tax=Brevundimonas sp. FT23042 TaxID=3393749 RepID=UPI003B586FEF
MLGRKRPFRRVLIPVALAAITPLLANCDRDKPAPVEPAPEAVAPTPAPTPLQPTAPLSRADLLAAVSRAASAYAAGQAGEGADPLVGRNFAIRTPFGCTGPASATGVEDGLAAWSWGPDQKTIQLSLTPGGWLNTALIAGAGDGDWESVEGVWLPRPWLTTDACPSIRTDALQSGAPAPSPQTVGLAAISETTDSRAGRRNGRAYTFTIRGEDDRPPAAPAGGYRTLLEGRIAAFPGGRAVRCRASSPDQRPVCIVAIRLDRVAFTEANGNVLTEWRAG